MISFALRIEFKLMQYSLEGEKVLQIALEVVPPLKKGQERKNHNNKQ